MTEARNTLTGNVNGFEDLTCGCIMRWHKHYKRGRRVVESDGVMIIAICGERHGDTILAKQAELKAS